jgi:hypothetical protein
MSSATFARRGSKAPQGGSGRLAWRGWTVRGSRGETLGTIEEIYVAEETATPDWALVRSDGPGASTTFLPLQGSRSEGNEVIVPFTRAQVTHAPHIEEASRLSPEQGAALYTYYGISDANHSPSEVPLGRAWEIVVAAEQRLTAQISQAWRQWLSNMRGHTETARSAPTVDKRPRSGQPKPRQGEQHADDKQR